MNIDTEALKEYIKGFNTIKAANVQERNELFKILEKECGFKIGFPPTRFPGHLYVSLGREEKTKIHCGYGGPLYENSQVINCSELESLFPDEDYSDEFLASLPDIRELLF